MSYAIDLNILLYASDSHSPRRAAATQFLREATERKDLLCIPYPVVLGYLRIATHPNILKNPLAPEEALQNIESLTTLPQARLLSEREGFLDDYRNATAALTARGNLVPDAHIATILRQHGVRLLYTSDRDFRRFEFLDVRDPFAND
ncbi:MAG TPA: TA system VapC family ribonuclease toxin [Thermoanaerobaculia bacterium]|nr:TA system VapC family ribonuclease toxin [Thermoanaerobaculia bacterium]